MSLIGIWLKRGPLLDDTTTDKKTFCKDLKGVEGGA